MPLAQETNKVARMVHDDGEEVGHVPPEDAPVEGVAVKEAGVLPTEHDWRTLVLFKLNASLNYDRGYRAAHAGERLRVAPYRKVERSQKTCMEHGAIRAGV